MNFFLPPGQRRQWTSQDLCSFLSTALPFTPYPPYASSHECTLEDQRKDAHSSSFLFLKESFFFPFGAGTSSCASSPCVDTAAAKATGNKIRSYEAHENLTETKEQHKERGGIQSTAEARKNKTWARFNLHFTFMWLHYTKGRIWGRKKRSKIANSYFFRCRSSKHTFCRYMSGWFWLKLHFSHFENFNIRLCLINDQIENFQMFLGYFFCSCGIYLM